MDNVNYLLRVFDGHLNRAGLSYEKLKNKRILEIGPGNSIGTALVSASCFAESYLIDNGNFACKSIGFYKELAAAGVKADDIPVVAFSVGEEELSGLDTTNLVGHLAAWNYFQSAESDLNTSFIKAWKSKMGDKRVTNDPMEAHVIGFEMYVKAVEKAGTTDVNAVRKAMYGMKVPNLTGGIAEMLPNHHLSKPVLIGEILENGQFDIISQTKEVPGDAWTDHLAESAPLKSDWKTLGCGMYNTKTKKCVQIKSNY